MVHKYGRKGWARVCAGDVTSRVDAASALVCVECGTQECGWYCSSDADGGYVTVEIFYYDFVLLHYIIHSFFNYVFTNITLT